MPPFPILRHVHIRGITPFAHAQALQSALLAQFLAHKDSASPSRPGPLPTILTFTPAPVYTFGRRDPPERLPPSLLFSLKEPLPPPPGSPPGTPSQVAEIATTLRGGQTTFHGPGTLVIYPILDIKGLYIRDPQLVAASTDGTAELDILDAIHPAGLGVREYVRALEASTTKLLEKWGMLGLYTPNPGVWIRPLTRALPDDTNYMHPVPQQEGQAPVEKIAALGVHIRRNVVSSGVALNVFTDLRWFDRITACGLEGFGTTSMRKWMLEAWLGSLRRGEKSRKWMRGVLDDEVLNVLGVQWAENFAVRLWGTARYRPDIRVSTRVGDLGLDLDSLGDGGYWKEFVKREHEIPLEEGSV